MRLPLLLRIQQQKKKETHYEYVVRMHFSCFFLSPFFFFQTFLDLKDIVLKYLTFCVLLTGVPVWTTRAV